MDDVTTMEIELSEQRWASSFNAGCATAIADLYDEDALVMMSDGRLDGRRAICASYESFLRANEGATIALELTRTRDAADLVVGSGDYAMCLRDENGAEAQIRGQYLKVWSRHASGRWLIVDEIFNREPVRSATDGTPALASERS